MPLLPHLELGSRWTFVGGKGGVGKTTVAAALSIELSQLGEPVTIFSTDPAHSLGDAFGFPLSSTARPVSGIPRLQAYELDPDAEREAFFRANGKAVSTLIERGTYLDPDDVEGVTRLSLPGMDELAAILELATLASSSAGRVIIDTAPTGHTLRLLDLPQVGLRWLEAMEAMEAKHAAIAAAFSGKAQEDETTSFLRDLRADLNGLAASFQDPSATRFVLVTTPEPGVLAETVRYRAELSSRGIAEGGIVVNRVAKGQSADPDALGASVRVPALAAGVAGPEWLKIFSAAATAGALEWNQAGSPRAATETVKVGERFTPPLDKQLYFVGGKGGVGKTTVAAALAIRLADARNGRVLLLSVDPAGSLGEVLGVEIRNEPEAIGGVSGLHAQQLDAGGAWESFVSRYRSDVQEMFRSPVGATGATLDREVLDRLMGLAPPGVDELMALVEVIDSLEDGRYDAIVLDSAPTGHFLRLLQMPGTALHWTHALLKLFLKYRQVVRLEGTGERVLKLSRTLRSLAALLADSRRTWAMVVALPESLSVPETERLLAAMRELALVPGALLVNRALDGPALSAGSASETAALIRGAQDVMVGGARLVDVGPSGVTALREFTDEWRHLTLLGQP